jgi:hypothetical protein
MNIIDRNYLVFGDNYAKTPTYKQLSTINEINPHVNNYLNPIGQLKQFSECHLYNYNQEKRKRFSQSYEVSANQGKYIDQGLFKSLRDSPIVMNC